MFVMTSSVLEKMGQVSRREYGVIILPKEVIKILLQSSKKLTTCVEV